MKIYYNGQRSKRMERDYEGKFTNFKRKCRSIFRGFVKLSIVAFAGYAVYVAGGIFQPRSIAVENIVEIDNLTPKIEELKGKLVADIQKCESAGHKENDGIIIFDSNNEASIGTLQFQRKTVQHYYKTLYGKTITPKEAVLIALDDEKAEQLAHDIIFKDIKGVSNWYNCANKTDAQGRIKIIKELQK